MNSKLYDILKYMSLIFLPATSAAYFTLASIWGFPNAEQVVGTIAVVETFIGTVVGISSHAYGKNTDGTLIVNGAPDQELLKLDMNHDLESLVQKNKLNITVSNNLS